MGLLLLSVPFVCVCTNILSVYIERAVDIKSDIESLVQAAGICFGSMRISDKGSAFMVTMDGNAKHVRVSSKNKLRVPT